MGFGNISSHLIIFIAVLVAASTVSVVLKNMVDTTGTSFMRQQNRLVEQMDTEINIDAVYYDNTTNTTSVYVRNLGTSRLKTEQVDVYLDSTRIPKDLDWAVLVLPDTDKENIGIWDPKEVIMITAVMHLAHGETHDVTVHTFNGVKAVSELSV